MKTEAKRLRVVRSDEELHLAVRDVIPAKRTIDVLPLDRALKGLCDRFGPEVYSTLFDLIYHVEFSPDQARKHWSQLIRRHDEMQSKLGTDLDFRVSGLEYLTANGNLSNPTIVETDDFVRIRHDTVTDGLTGLYNFRHFRRSLEKEVSRANRYRTPLSLLFIDVDHFKKFNDQCGHPIGDLVLKHVAEVIAGSIRSSDLPCRYGGEEFSVIAPDTGKDGAMLLADRIRRGVEALQVPEAALVGRVVTVSGGVASFPEDATSAHELIARADEALYSAKRDGRNRIETRRGERRKVPRFDVSIPGTYSILPNSQKPLATKNLSEGGALIQSDVPLPPGSVIPMEVSIERDADPVRFLGKVAHLKEAVGERLFDVGVSILRMSRLDAGRLREFLASRSA
ncbi:MAG TPA: diguanylate cyclase [Bdellovibrionota bacterium]|nr:diguanylate cyclase [Bdellovibrionota bacterium]